MLAKLAKPAVPIYVALVSMMLSMQAHAQFSRVVSGLQAFLAGLKLIVPIIATIVLIILGVMYAKRIVHKDTFVHWFVGIFIAGSAAEFVAVVWGA